MRITDDMRIALERAQIDSGRETDAMIAAVWPFIIEDAELELDKTLHELATEKEISRVLRDEYKRAIQSQSALLEILKHILESDMAQREEDEGQQCAILNRARAVIADVEGRE